MINNIISATTPICKGCVMLHSDTYNDLCDSLHICILCFDLSSCKSVLVMCNLYICLVMQTQWAPIPDADPTCTKVNSSPGIVLPDFNNTTPTLTADTLVSGPAAAAASTATPRCMPTPVEQRPNPLPVFEWADSRQMWETMMSKEELPGYHRDNSWFSRHTLLQSRMRTVLFDWLMEVISSLYLCV